MYADDPHWVPPLLSPIRDRLDSWRNPYFEHADVACFLAKRDGEPVGRISAQVCQLAQQFHGHGSGHFGFFECEDSQATANVLFDAAQNWLKRRRMTRMLGPFDLSINDEVGLLVEGFDRPPSFLMGHHRPYYQTLMEGTGLQKEMDVYAYYLDITRPYTDRIQRIVQRASRDQRIVVRPIDKKNFARELRHVLEVFKAGWADNWGFVPPTTAEVDYLIRSIRRPLDRGAVMLTEVEGELAGFMVVLPNLNELIRDLDGKLFPIGWLRLLWRLKFGPCHSVRVPLMGVHKQHQKTRLGAAIALSMIDRCRRDFLLKGVTHCEMSWILETNTSMRSILDAAGCERDKCYRFYSKRL
jgi:GNAT superfamily N-acetyltransferase